MNFNNQFLKTFAISLFLAVGTKNPAAFGEIKNSPKINTSKPSTPEEKIVFAKEINHIFIGARIITQFSPKNQRGERISLQQLASDLGYDHFNWVSYVEKDPHGIADRTGKQLTTPYNDPPQGGYQYDAADMFPFYWDVEQCELCNQRHHFQNYNNLQQYTLVFEDAPADYRLKPGEAVEFLTSLVGVKKMNPHQKVAEWDVLHTFRWKLTNPSPNYSQVSLMDRDVDLSQLSPLLLNKMVLDGAAISSSTRLSNSN